MAKGKGEIKGWITKNGVHIPIYGTYTVRGGVEPKAKGSKFKRKKKPEHEVIDRTTPQGDYDTKSGDERKQRLIDYIVRKEGLDEAAATERYENMRLSERDVMGYEAFKEESRAARANSNIVNHKDYTKNAEQQKKWQDISKAVGDYDANNDKYVDRDWNKDVDDAKRYGYSEQTEEGKKPVTKAEEEKQTRQSFKDKKAQELGFADDASMRSYNEETGVNRESWKEQKSSKSTFSPESSAQTINDMARRRANGGGKNDDWKIANQTLESAPAGTTMIQTGNRGVKFQYTKGEDGKWHSSAGEDYTQDSKTLSMSWRGESGPSVEFTTPDKALSNADIKATHTAVTNGRLNQTLGLDRNNKPIGNRSTRKVDTSTSKSYPWTKSTAEPAANELGRAYSEANKAKEKFTGMSVTALKSAYKNAVGSERGAIYQLLKAKGYRIVNGKWMKG